jgi:hypothetical protein
MNSEFDYDETRDDLPKKTTTWIIIIAIIAAAYLSQIMV